MHDFIQVTQTSGHTCSKPKTPFPRFSSFDSISISVFLYFPRLLAHPPPPNPLFSWINRESNYISVGLAAWRWRAAWLWANTWPWLEEQRRRSGADRCAAGSFGRQGSAACEWCVWLGRAKGGGAGWAVKESSEAQTCEPARCVWAGESICKSCVSVVVPSQWSPKTTLLPHHPPPPPTPSITSG